jgi:hypothetical protein
MKRILGAVALLIGLSVVGLVAANWWVGGDSTATVEGVARSKCIQEGFPAKTMTPVHLEADDHLIFGGGATVVFAGDGRKLRVELRKRMNLTGWEAVSVVEESSQ